MTRAVVVTARTNHPGQDDLTLRFIDNIRDKLSSKDELIIVSAGEEIDYDEFITINLLKNESFSNSMNAGIKAALQLRPEYVIVMGNDGFPTDANWIDNLIKAQKETDAAVVCPQPSRPVLSTYDGTKIGELKGYPLDRMFPAICWLLPIDTLRKTGYFDERFIGGTYEDNDYLTRVQLWGGTTIVNPEVFLIHELSQTVQHMNVPKLMNENRERFFKKWGLS
jgi:GT2 family glycosyltransferase